MTPLQHDSLYNIKENLEYIRSCLSDPFICLQKAMVLFHVLIYRFSLIWFMMVALIIQMISMNRGAKRGNTRKRDQPCKAVAHEVFYVGINFQYIL